MARHDRRNRMMMNFVALGLLATSLAVCGVWSPSPEPHHRLRRDELLSEGHRVIVVEYERHVPVGEPRAREEPAHHSATKDKICDAYGVCRDTLSSLLGKTKDKLSEAEHIAQDKVARVKEGAEDAISKAKSKAAQLREGAEERATDAAERVVDKAEGAKDALEDAVGAVKEKGRDAAANASASAAGKAEAAEHVTRRNLSDVARDAVACACAWAPVAGRAAAGVAHLVAAAAAYGTCVWVTFVSSHVLAAALPRQQFGVVQSKLYPVYFRAVACCVGAALLAQLLARDRRVASERVQGYNLLAALALVLVNMLFLEPKATKAMFERMKLEKEEGKGRDVADMVEPGTTTTTAGSPTTAAAATATSAVPRNPAKWTMADPETMKSRITKLNKRLKRLNNYSSTLNIVTMMGLSWHLVHLAHQLQMQR